MVFCDNNFPCFTSLLTCVMYDTLKRVTQRQSPSRKLGECQDKSSVILNKQLCRVQSQSSDDNDAGHFPGHSLS